MPSAAVRASSLVRVDVAESNKRRVMLRACDGGGAFVSVSFDFVGGEECGCEGSEGKDEARDGKFSQ